MSYRIEYQWRAWRIPPERTQLRDDRFVVAVEGGDNNSYSLRNGRSRRSRDWEVLLIGTAATVIRQAHHYARGCAGGMLKPHNRPCTPEAYVSRVSRLIANARNELSEGTWLPRIHTGNNAVLDAELLALGIPAADEPNWRGNLRRVYRFPPDALGIFFELTERYCSPETCPAWDFAEVRGLPSS